MAQTQELTALDRCDRCGAAAAVAFVIKGAETPLMMCGHHIRANHTEITKAAESIWDYNGNVILDRANGINDDKEAREFRVGR